MAKDIQRILLVTIPGAGGVLDYMQNLITYLRQACPHLILDLAFSSLRGSDGMGRLVDEIKAKGGEVVDLKLINAPQVGDVGAARKIARLVKRRQPQLIHAQSFKAGNICRLLQLRTGAGFPPIVYTPHAYFGLDKDHVVRAWFFNHLERALGNRSLTLNCSLDERNFGKNTLRIPGRKLVLIHHGINLKKFHPASLEEKLRARQKLGFPHRGTLLVSVGRNAFQKNYRPLYRAIDRLMVKAPHDFFFAHAGDRSEKLAGCLAPSNRARMCSFQHLDNIEDLFHAADGFILTSRYEGLSLSVLQALACGLKVFLTAVPGNTSLRDLGFDEISWVTPDRSESVLASRIETSLLPWLKEPSPPHAGQVERARALFNDQIQCGKILRAYRRAASHAER